MRKKLRRKIAHMSQDRKNEGNKLFREMRRDEKNFIETDEYKRNNERTKTITKTELEQQRTFKLLSRGIPSHFYKNLNKSQN